LGEVSEDGGFLRGANRDGTVRWTNAYPCFLLSRQPNRDEFLASFLLGA